MRALIQIGWRLRRLLLRLMRVRTRGVKAMLFNRRGEILLIRNTYGNRAQFALPGGGIGRGESPEQAARREVREEVALEVGDLRCVSRHHASAEGKRDTVFLFTGTVDGTPRADGREVEEAAFFALDALPDRTSPAARRRIAEYRAGRCADGPW